MFKQLHSKAAGPGNCSIKCHQDPQNTRNFFCTKRQGIFKTQRQLDPQKARKKRKEKRKETKRQGKEGQSRFVVEVVVGQSKREALHVSAQCQRLRQNHYSAAPAAVVAADAQPVASSSSSKPSSSSSCSVAECCPGCRAILTIQLPFAARPSWNLCMPLSRRDVRSTRHTSARVIGRGGGYW